MIKYEKTWNNKHIRHYNDWISVEFFYLKDSVGVGETNKQNNIIIFV